MERAAHLAGENPEVLYDLAVIRLAAGNETAALEALKRALAANTKLRAQASADADLAPLRRNPQFQPLVHEER
jgi:hypothetical protein